MEGHAKKSGLRRVKLETSELRTKDNCFEGGGRAVSRGLEEADLGVATEGGLHSRVVAVVEFKLFLLVVDTAQRASPV